MKRHLGWSLGAIALVCAACVSRPVQQDLSDASEMRRVEEAFSAHQAASAELRNEVNKLSESVRQHQESDAATSARTTSQYEHLLDEIRRLNRPTANNGLNEAIKRQGEAVAGALDGVASQIHGISAALESFAATNRIHQVQLRWPDNPLSVSAPGPGPWAGIAMAFFSAILGAIVAFTVAKNTADRNEKIQYDAFERQTSNQRKVLYLEGKLARITAQLNDLYAPFYLMTKSSSDLFNDFCSNVKRDPDHFFEKDAAGNLCPPSPDALVEWRHVMKHVFFPINRARERIALTHAALVDDKEFADQLVEMISHIADFRRLIKGWPTPNDANTAAAAWAKGRRSSFAPDRQFRGKDLLASAERGFNRLNDQKRALQEELRSLPSALS